MPCTSFAIAWRMARTRAYRFVPDLSRRRDLGGTLHPAPGTAHALKREVVAIRFECSDMAMVTGRTADGMGIDAALADDARGASLTQLRSSAKDGRPRYATPCSPQASICRNGPAANWQWSTRAPGPIDRETVGIAALRTSWSEGFSPAFVPCRWTPCKVPCSSAPYAGCRRGRTTHVSFRDHRGEQHGASLGSRGSAATCYTFRSAGRVYSLNAIRDRWTGTAC